MGQSVGRSEALVPDTVENLKVHVNPNIPSVTLTWTPPLILEAGTLTSDINRYHIRFKPSRGQHYEEVFVDGSTNSIIIDRKLGLTTNTTYSFEIRAQNDDDVGEWKAVSAFVDLFPGGVQNLRANRDTSIPSVMLEWDKPSNCETDQDVTSYDIRFRPSGSPDEEGYCNMTVRAPATSIVLTRESGLTPLVEYQFEVRAKNPSYDGNWSSKSKYIAFTPDPVQKLTATVDTHKPSVTLKWDPPANARYPGDVTKYQICFWDKEKGCYVESTVDGSTTTTVITRESGLRPLTTTTFEVRACSGDDVSPEWRTVSTFVALDPDPVENLKVHMDPCVPSVTLTWAPPQNSGLPSPDSCLDVSRYHIRFKSKGSWRYDEKTVDGSTTSLVLKRESGLTPHTTFIFEVSAQSGDCVGQWKTVSTFVDLFPGEVQNLRSTLDPNTASLTLAWDRPSNCETTKDVTAYDIWFKPCTSLEREGYCKTAVKGSATSVHLTRECGLKPLMNYQFEIRARNAGYDGNWSRILKHIAFTPDPVQKLTAAVDTHRPSVTLKWDPPANAGYPGYITKYQIRFWDEEKGCYIESTVDGSATITVITRKTGLRPLTDTTFEVRACSGEDVSPEWRTVSAFVALDPDPVENLKIHMDPSVPSVTLTWAPPQNSGLVSPDSCLDVSRYHIRFKSKGTWRYKEMTVDGSTTSLVLKRESGLTPHTTFIFEVSAQSGDCLGPWKTVAAFVDLLPAEVQNLRSTMDPRTGILTLEWDKPMNCETVQDVTVYDVRFKPCKSLERKDYQMMTVKATARKIVLTRESGLKPLKNYEFEVRARNAGYEGNWSGILEHIGLTVQNLTAVADPLKPSVTLKWEPPGNEYAADVTGYQIRFWCKKKSCYNKMLVDASTTAMVITRESGLKPLTMSTFEVRACSGDDVGQEKKTVSAFVALKPGPIQNLKAAVDSHKPAVTLKWDPPANAGYPGDVTDYHVRFWDDISCCYKEKFLDGSITTTVIKTESGLRPLTISMFEVRAHSGDNISQEWMTVATFVALTPDPVQNLIATVDTHEPSVTLKWDPPANAASEGDVTKYQVRFRGMENCCYIEKTVDGSTTTTVITRESGLRPLTETTFEVRACCSDAVSREWRTVSKFVALTPDPVQNLTASVDTHKPCVALKWDPPANAGHTGNVTKYQVRFRDTEKGCCNEKIVNGSTTATVIARKSGLRPLTMYTFDVRACCGDDVSQEWRTVSAFVALTPGPVQNLTATVDSYKPAVTLKWDPPANAGYVGDVTDYQVRFWDNEKSCYKEKFVEGSITTTVITRDSGLRPLTTSTFEVRACSGIDESQEWRAVSTFVAIVPDSVENLKVHVDSNIPSATLTWNPPHNCVAGTQCTCSDVSSYDIRFKQEGQHYNEVNVNGDITGIVFSEESGLSLHTTFTFEVRAQSGENFGEWKAVSAFIGCTGVMKLDSRSQEFIDLCDKFQKDWAMNKGPCPSITAIVKIVNSIVSLRFEDYPLKLDGIEQHYHGTTLCCDLANSADLCNDPNCGACGITRRGFDPLRIGSRTWQRFGKGFYFTPNSSKAYDYAIGNRFGANRIATRNTRYSAIFLCDIAPGRKYTTKFNRPNQDGPPTGYNSIHGERGKDLNYDEIVVYDSHAICPQYVIFCQK